MITMSRLCGILVILSIFFISCSSVKELEGYKINLKSDDVALRREAAEKICRMGPKADRCVNELVEALKDKDPIVRRYAIETLGSLQPAMSDDFNTLFIWVLNDPDLDVRRTAVVAAGKLDNFPGNIITILQKRLGDSDRLVREFSMSAFENIGQYGIGALQRALKDPDPIMRLSAVTVLGKMGPTANRALNDIKRVQETDESEEVKNAAALALKTIPNGPTEQSTVEENQVQNPDNKAIDEMLQNMIPDQQKQEEEE